MPDLNPRGHGKLELRGLNLNIFLNIDGGEVNNYYDILIIKGDMVHKIGRIYTDENKSGKGKYSLNYRELEKSGFSLERINGILILRDRKILLGGYFIRDDKSLDLYIEKLAGESVEAKSPYESEPDNGEGLEEKSDLVEEKIDAKDETDLALKAELHQGIEDTEEIERSEREQVAKDTIGPSEDIGEKVLEAGEVDGPKEMPADPKEVDRSKEKVAEPEEKKAQEGPITETEYKKAMEEAFRLESESKKKGPGGIFSIDLFEEFPETFSHDKEAQAYKQSSQDTEETAGYVLNILNYFPSYKPFTLNLKGYDWWKIDVEDPQNDRSFLPYFSYIIDGDKAASTRKGSITASQLMKSYGHYLFGFYNEKSKVKFYLYAIPGDFTEEEHPLKGSTGFNTWFKGRDIKGYWLLYIEASSGRIIYPINPMIPV